MLRLTSATFIAATAAAGWLASGAHGHSWIDCIDTDRKVVYDNAREWIYGGARSNGICKGYMKNYPGRGDPDINTKMTFKILMADVIKGSPVCESGPYDYSGWRHRIKVRPGETFYYGYLDNGHNSKDKAGRGTLYGVYWTGAPGSSLDMTTDLTEDRLIDGKLHDFDDGNCGQTFEDGDFSGNIRTGRAGNDYSCVGDLKMPMGTKPGIYNLVWFWKFYNDKVNANVRTTGGQYGGAAYSSCFQVEVINGENGDDNGSPLAPVRPPKNDTAVTPTKPSPLTPPTSPPTQPPATPSPTTKVPIPAPSPTQQTPAPTPAPSPKKTKKHKDCKMY